MEQRRIQDLLQDLGIRPRCMGFKYIISMAKLGNEKLLHLMDAYAEVAEMYNVTPVAMERAIRYAMTEGTERVTLDRWSDVLGFPVHCPMTNGELLSVLAEMYSEAE